MAATVFITGGSGFVGSAVIAELLSRGNRVHALTNRKALQSAPNLRSINGDLFSPDSLDEGMRGCDAVIHLVGIIMEKPSKGITYERIHFEGTRAVVDAAVRNGVKRYLHMSAIGTRRDAPSAYHQTKYKAEQLVQASPLDWTIIRPSMIHGPRGEFMKMEAMWARKKAPPPLFVQPFMPYFSSQPPGRIQPVLVEEVARAFVDALEKSNTIGQTYDLGGTEKLTWPQMHDISAQAIVGHRRLFAPIPATAGKLLASVGVGSLLGFNRDQVILAQEDNTCDLTPFVDAFGWTPASFSNSIQRYAARL